jgi:hypothetical protein
LKKAITIVLLILISTYCCLSQNLLDDMTPPAPKTARQNTGQFFGGIAMQALGVGMLIGSGYLLVLYPEEMAELAVYGFMGGAACAIVGTGLMIRSVSNMIATRKAIRDVKKNLKEKDITLYFGPTNYGLGLVCRF